MKTLKFDRQIKELSKRWIAIVLFGVFSLSVHAGLAVLDLRDTIRGQHDIKMISSVVLQPAWISQADPYIVDTIVSNAQILSAGDDLAQNNRYGGSGSGDNDYEVQTKVAWLAAKPASSIGTTLLYADCDDDYETFQSSAAFLDFGEDNSCTYIEKAYLYWSGMSTTSTGTNYASYPGFPTLKSYNVDATHPANVGDTRSNAYQEVLFKASGETSYSTVTADRDVLTYTSGGNRYMCVADVTDLVEGKSAGLYWVANVRSSSIDGGGGASGGWALVVVFRPPNCPPRTIKIWDASGIPATGEDYIDFTFDPAYNEVPASGNSISYLGFLGLDAEDTAPALLDAVSSEDPAVLSSGSLSKAQQSRLTFNGGAGNVYIQPFTDGDQPPVTACTDKAICIDDAYWGLVSSQITTWDDEEGTNGNQVTRVPNNRATMGWDAHHLRLPSNAFASGATSARLTLPKESNGDWSVCMAYMAIQTLQAELQMDMEQIAPANNEIALGENITYQITVKNLGLANSTAGAYILDTMLKTLDFADNVTFLDKDSNALTANYQAFNQNQDDNEYVRFTLPAIAKSSDGLTANDSVRIIFDVKVKDADRTDIWSYSCNSTIYNRATLVYQGDDGSDISVGSNSSAGCSGQGVYSGTPIIDSQIRETFEEYHEISDTLTNEVVAAEAQSTHLYKVEKMKEYIQVGIDYASLGSVMTPDSFEFIDMTTNLEVDETDYFTTDQETNQYHALYQVGDGCVEHYYFDFTISRIPTATIDTASIEEPDYPTHPSGSFIVHAAGGEPSYNLTVKDSDGQTVFESNSPASSSEYDFEVKGLTGDTYTYVLIDQSGISTGGQVELEDKEEMVVSISGLTSMCGTSKDSITLTVNHNRTSNDGLEILWEQSYTGAENTYVVIDSIGSTPIVNATSIKVLPEQTTFYKVYVCDAAVSGSDTHTIAFVQMPHTRGYISSKDSACQSINIYDRIYSKLDETGFPFDDFDMSFHTDLPNSATDNTYLIPRSKYDIEEPGMYHIIIRMSTHDKACWTYTTTNIDLRTMDQCYPISTPAFFSPDGDGINDRLFVEGIENYNNPEVIIYDRYGKKVFIGGKDDISLENGIGWDGTYNGNNLPTGDYWYQFSFTEDVKQKIGHFTLKRRRE